MDVSSDGRRAATNVVLWLVFFAVLLAVGCIPVFRVHGAFTLDAVLGLFLHLIRAGMFLSVGLLIESFLMRSKDGRLTQSPKLRSFIHLYWILIMFGILLFIVDAFVYAFAGYHLSTAIRILFADGAAGAGRVLEATGLSPLKILGAVAGAAVFAALSIFLSKKTRNLSMRWNLIVPRRRAWRLFLLCLGLLVGTELLGLRLRNPFLWEEEIRSIPLGFSILRPEAALASFRVRVKPLQPLAAPVSQSATCQAIQKPDIYIIVIESLRRDMMAPDTMPRLSAFAQENTSVSHAITTGNVTHYSWYGLFCGNYPIYFDVAKQNPQLQGSLPIALLRQAGYQIKMLATPDTAYQNLESIVFGPQGKLLDQKFHPADKAPADRDRKVMNEVVRSIRSDPEGGTLRIIAFDSTHYDYAWGPDFRPPFSMDNGSQRPYISQENTQRVLETRYRNSVAWVDSLLGEFFDALKTSGRLERSVVIITGDHGEAFWEHGSGTHGSNLMSEQMEVAFAMHLPKTKPGRADCIFSLMDVMPSILTEVGIPLPSQDRLPGTPLQQRLTTAEGKRPGSALTFQGWNERAFRFALSYEDKRILYELSSVDPTQSQKLLIKRIYSLDGNQEILGKTCDAKASRQCMGDLPRMLEVLPFLEME